MSLTLDEFQRKLYDEPFYPAHAYLLKAVAGAGKSHTILSKTLRLIEEGTPPPRILLTSFTNASANELRQRFTKALPNATELPLISTIHGFGREILKRTPYVTYSIATEWNSILIMRDLIELHIPKYRELSKTQLTSIASAVHRVFSKLRNRGLIHYPTFRLDLIQNITESPAEELTADQVVTLITAYHKEKIKLELMDYDDMVWLPLQLLKKEPKLKEDVQASLDYYFIDEAQDLCQLQYDLVMECAQGKTLVMVGDLCQSIYGFRDATPQNFSADYLRGYGFAVKEFQLKNNYRSEPSIVKVSNLCRDIATDPIQAIPTKPSAPDSAVKIILANNNITEGNHIAEKIKELLLTYSPADLIVICRTNRYLKTTIEPAMIQANIPYQLIGGTSSKRFLDKPVSQFLLDTISYLINRNNHYALISLLEHIKGIGKSNLDTIHAELKSNRLSTKADIIRQIQNTLDNILSNATKQDDPYLVIDSLVELHRTHCLASSQADDKTLELIHASLCNFISLQREAGFTEIMDILNQMLTEVSVFEGNDTRNRIRLATIHSQKGCESPVVFACGFNYQRENHNLKNPEEANILYVQLSRAIEKLFIVDSKVFITKGGDTISNYKNPYFAELVERIKSK